MWGVFNFHPGWHLFFDILGLGAASYSFRKGLGSFSTHPEIQGKVGYWIHLVIGAVTGAYLVGSFNLSLLGSFVLGHSIAGALTGAILSVEIYKLRHKAKGSTGYVFVIPLACGVSVGRLGCFFSGLPDQTFGIATNFWLGIDFGDGIHRHPVQLYESASLFLGLFGLLIWRQKSAGSFQRISFYVFILFYSSQRWVWEFLKPYSKIIGPFNIFHLICFALVAYAVCMIRMADEPTTGLSRKSGLRRKADPCN